MNSEAKRKRILKAIRKGKKYVEISKRYHVSFTTINEIKKDNSWSYGKKRFMTSEKIQQKESPEFLSYIALFSLVAFWILLIIQFQPMSFIEYIWRWLASVLYAFLIFYIFIELRKHKY